MPTTMAGSPPPGALKPPKTYGFRSFLSLRQKIDQDVAAMKNERVSFDPTWSEMARFTMPRRPRFTITDTNRGERRNLDIIDATATRSLGTLRAGMLSGLTSPTRLWFNLKTPYDELNEIDNVKQWLYLATNRMDSFFRSTNLYNVLPIHYGDMGLFATGATLVDRDDKDGLVFISMPIGSYWLANDRAGRVNTFYRELQKTVQQLLEEFGERDEEGNITNWENFSQMVRTCHDNSQLQTWIQCGHIIRPNPEREPDAPGAKGKKWLSAYFELGLAGGTNTYAGGNLGADQMRFLRLSGYDRFPVLVGIWGKTGEDSYGTESPGLVCIGDVRQIQVMERRSNQAIEKNVHPPMQAPASMRGQRISTLPGDVTYVDQRSNGEGFRPAYQVNLPIRDVEEKCALIRQRIQDSYYTPLFLMLSNEQMSQPITAREVQERHEEKLLQLGPVLESVCKDILDPLIDLAFDALLERGELPPPPPELRKVKLEVEYISIFAQAIKLVALGGLERLLTQLQGIVALNPEALDTVDFDEYVRKYIEMLGIPPTIQRSKEVVEGIRKGRLQMQQQQAQAQQASMMAETANKLAASPLDQDNALQRLLDDAKAGAIA